MSPVANSGTLASVVVRTKEFFMRKHMPENQRGCLASELDLLTRFDEWTVRLGATTHRAP